MEGLELVIFQIISTVGTARSCYIEAIKAARTGDFEKAEKLMEEGVTAFAKGHEFHAGLIQKEADGDHVEVSLLLIHAEDQLMSAETFKILAEEIIETNKLVYHK